MWLRSTPARKVMSNSRLTRSRYTRDGEVACKLHANPPTSKTPVSIMRRMRFFIKCKDIRIRTPRRNDTRLVGSGTACGPSFVKERPPGSPVTVTPAIPPANATSKNSLGLLPFSPKQAGPARQAKLLLNRKFVEWTERFGHLRQSGPESRG